MATQQMPLINITDLRVNRGGHTILCVDRLSIDSRQRVAIYGRNGSGKTTLLRVLAGFERHNAGTCTIDAPRRQRVFVHQNPCLLRGSVLFNAMYGLRARGLERRRATTQASAMLERLGIGALAGRSVDRLSSGERRRTALAAAIVIEPTLLMLDEPLADIDDEGTNAIRDVLGSLENSAIVMTCPTQLPQGFAHSQYRLG